MSDARIEEATAFLAARGIAGGFDCAVVLGTGLGALADDLRDAVCIPYGEVPHFREGAVSGHGNRLVAGRLGQKRVLLLQGRTHFYETGDAGAMRVPLGVVRALGAPPLLLTNAAGSLRREIGPGRLVLVTDHISGTGTNPLVGEGSDARFVSMTDAYDPGLRARMGRAGASAHLDLAQGVYMWFSGPSFETPAEVRMAGVLGADLVGMSTVPEVILARFMGLRVAAVSVVTNWAAGIGGASPSHEETKAVSAAAGQDLRRLMDAFLAEPGDV